METQSFRYYQYSGLLLLAEAVGWKPPKLVSVLEERYDYRTVAILKRNGRKRLLCIPPPSVKQFQKLLLSRFLYRLHDRGMLSSFITGFLPKSSIRQNALRHAVHGMNHVIRLDLKDAFPSVTAEAIEAALLPLLYDELELYKKRVMRQLSWIQRETIDNPQRQLFPRKHSSWLWWMMNNPTPQREQNLRLYVRDFVSWLVQLVTYKGRLPQGSPCSPFLLNLVLSRSGMLGKLRSRISELSPHFSLTVYADDITISTATNIRSHIPELIRIIEKNSIFKVNRTKTACFSHSSQAPMVTGLRITRRVLTEEEMVDRAQAQKRNHNRQPLLYEEKLERVGSSKQIEKRRHKNQMFISHEVALPKVLQRRIRGMLHAALTDDSLMFQVEGYVRYAKSIYPHGLPKQIAVPYERYRLKMYGNSLYDPDENRNDEMMDEGYFDEIVREIGRCLERRRINSQR